MRVQSSDSTKAGEDQALHQTQGGSPCRQLAAWDGRKPFELNVGELGVAGLSGGIAAPISGAAGIRATALLSRFGPAAVAGRVVVEGVSSGAVDAAAQRALQEIGLKIELDIGACWYQPTNPRARC